MVSSDTKEVTIQYTRGKSTAALVQRMGYSGFNLLDASMSNRQWDGMSVRQFVVTFLEWK